MHMTESDGLRAENESLRLRVEALEHEKAEAAARRARLEGELAKLQRIMKKLPVNVRIFDFDQKKMVFSSSEMGTVLGYSPEEYLALTPSELFHPDDLPMYQRMVQECIDRNDVHDRLEWRVRRSDGTYTWMAVENRVLDRHEDGKLRTALAVSYDITTTKQSEEALRVMNEQLDALVEERTASLAEANERLVAENARCARISEEAERRANLIRDLSAPVLRVWDSVVTIPIIGALDAARAELMTVALLGAVSSSGVRFAILDLTAGEIIEGATTENLERVVRAVALLGAEVVICGVQPQAARMMATQGLMLDVPTRQTLRDALRYCMRRLREGGAASATG
jgi:PAS domain S-box-containing protein